MAFDSKNYSSQPGFLGFAATGIAAMALISIAIYIFTVAPRIMSGEEPVLYAFVGGLVLFSAAFAFFLKSNGMLLNVPFRAMENGVLIQPVLSVNPAFVPYDSISRIELWAGAGHRKAKNGCSVLHSGGVIRSVEAFRGKEALKEFTGELRPFLEARGLKLKSSDEAGRSLHIVFQRGMRLGV